ncbi:MAG TPA: glutamate racemase [Flavobacterium sp.]|jgi:glutamate racemase
MDKNAPIGLFDSGVGGTSIWKEIHALLPYEDTIYLADSMNAPYGEKSRDEILALSIKNTELLLSLNCKIVVVACNTATTNAIKELRALYKVPFIGIEPAIKPAANNSATQIIGILATKGTLSSELFSKAVETYHNTRIIEQVGNGLVELIEDGKTDSVEIHELLVRYLTPMIRENIDYLVLGCSHYPYLVPQIKTILPPHIKIIDSGEAVARQTHHILQQRNGLAELKKGRAVFYTNSSPDTLKCLLGKEYSVIEREF